jgi:hypothetical protein
MIMGSGLPERINFECDYCMHDLGENWESNWGDNEEQHYKAVECDNCSKKNWVKVDFVGSGHDRDFGKCEKTLESTLKKVPEKDI